MMNPKARFPVSSRIACRVLVAAGIAVAGFASLPAQAETTLRLSETATVMVAPDELAAMLRTDVVSATAADAQTRVNAAMRDALAAAHKVHGVTASTGAYSVWRSGPTPQDRTERWHASQTLNLSSADGPGLLTLVGELQGKGLAVANLGWRLSRDAQKKAHQEATRQALKALRSRVDEAAELLNLRFDQYKDVTLDGSAPQPRMRAMAAPMAAMAKQDTPPSVEAEDLPVSATAQADAILVPR